MRIGILTYHKAINYGAYLQAYALTMFLRELGYDSEIIDFNMQCAEDCYRVKGLNLIYRHNANIRYKTFIKEQTKLPVSKEKLVSNKIEDFSKFIEGKYDIIIAGSDEIWRLDSFRGFPTPYWLMGEGDYRRFSYAASSRSDFSKLSNQDIEMIRETLKKFELIGVRDNFTYLELRRILANDKNLYMCCDPVFLYDFQINAEYGRELLKTRYHISGNKPVLGVMVNDGKLAKVIKHELDNEFDLVALYTYWPGYIITSNLSPFEWVNVVAALDIMVSNYFHGICFALLSDVYFIAIDSREENVQNGKLYDLLKRNDYLDTFSYVNKNGYIEDTIKLCRQKKGVNVNFSKIVMGERLLSKKYIERLKQML